MKRFFSLFLVVIVCFAVVGCKKNDDKLKVGTVAPLTGNLATYGNSVVEALQLAFEEINASGGILGKQVDFTYYDDAGVESQALEAYTRLYGKGIDFFIGEVTSVNTEAVASKAAEDEMPMLTPTATAASITINRPTVFRSCFLDPQQGVALANFTKNGLENITDVYVLYDNSDDYSKGIADSYIDKAEELGINVVGNEGGLRATESNYATIVTKVKNSTAQAVLVPVYYELASIFVKQLVEAGFTGKILGADGFDGIMSVDGVVKETYNNCYFSNHYASDSTDQKVKDFTQSYKAKYNSIPNALAALAYDAAYIMKEAYEQAGEINKEKVVAALATIEFTGVTGNMKFNASGDPVKSLTIVKYDNGNIIYVADASGN